MNDVEKDPARAIEKLLSRLDEEDKKTLNWLIASARYMDREKI